MLKKIVSFIFIYIFIIGCDNIMAPDCSGYYLDTNAPSLEIDGNGYYHIEFLNDYSQTFTTLKAETGITDNYQKVKWISDYEYNMGNNNWVNLVNQHSYTDDEGYAYTVLSVWQEFVGDTITVYTGYSSGCGIQFTDTLGVIVE